jgi:hypothetical protein
LRIGKDALVIAKSYHPDIGNPIPVGKTQVDVKDNRNIAEYNKQK